MIQLNEETRKALLQLARETQVYPEGNILKLIDAADDSVFKAYIEKAMARDRQMRQRRLEVTKQVQIQNRDLIKFNEQVTALNADLMIALEEQKKAKEQVIHALKILEKKNRDLAQFSWMTSHNLRGPLASALGIINLLRDVLQSSADLKGLYDHLRGSAMKMDEVLADLSMLLESREEVTIDNQVLALDDVLAACKDRLREIEADLPDAVTIDCSACPTVVSTRSHVEEVLRHVLLNGFQYRSSGRPSKVTVTSFVEDQQAVISVSDNGVGIAADDLEKVFEPFKKLSYTSTGKGLGLYLARIKAEALGGTLTVTSVQGEGSVFSLRLPVDGHHPSV